MPELYDGMLLYHGSYCEVKQPDLANCADFKDFGKGFYVTSSREQAEKFIDTSLKKARAQGVIGEEQRYGVVGSEEADRMCISRLIPERLKNQFCFRTDKSLKVLSFEGSERIWKN